MKRNIITEIKKLKEREKTDSIYFFESRMRELHEAYEQIVNHRLSNEFYKQIPVSLVATMESFFYTMVSKIIDHGDPYTSNVTKFNQVKDVKFDFDIVNAINAKDFSMGNFIAHVLPFNNLLDINNNLSVLLKVDFLSEMKKHKADSIFDDNVKTSEAFINNSDTIIKNVIRTFELRHIFCHEFAYDYYIDISEIKTCLNSIEVFLKQATNFIHHVLYPNSPETQAGMNQQSFDEFNSLEKEFDELLETAKEAYRKSEFGFSDELFEKMIDAWKSYREVKANFDSFYVLGGSMWSLAFSSSKSLTTSFMIDNLKNEITSLQN